MQVKIYITINVLSVVLSFNESAINFAQSQFKPFCFRFINLIVLLYLIQSHIATVPSNPNSLLAKMISCINKFV